MSTKTNSYAIGWVDSFVLGERERRRGRSEPSLRKPWSEAGERGSRRIYLLSVPMSRTFVDVITVEVTAKGGGCGAPHLPVGNTVGSLVAWSRMSTRKKQLYCMLIATVD